MRDFSRTGVVVAACFLLTSGSRVQAQMGGGIQGGSTQAAPPTKSNALAKLKVGDSIMATGSLKSGAFTALKMDISGPGELGRARNRAAQGQAAPTAPQTSDSALGSVPDSPPGVPPQ